MAKTKSRRRLPLKPLEDGQTWRVAGMNLHVGTVGKLLVHYQLAKPDALRMTNQVNSKTTIEKYLKKNKAVLMRG